MDLKELGQLLQQQREALGLTIEDISESTRISRRILTIFEAGDVDSYPHPVYSKGFIRNYARALGLDEDMCIRTLEKELAIAVPEDENGDGHPTLHELEEPLVASGGSSWPIILGCLVLVGLLAGMIWYFSFGSQESAHDSGMEASAPAATQKAEPAAGAHAASVPDAVSETGPETVSEAGAESVPQTVQQGLAAAEEPLQAAAGDTSALPQTQTGTTAPNHGGLHTLSIEVVGKQPCWVGVWLPGQEAIAKDFTVPVGETVEYRFSGDRLIRFGRIEAVKLTFDGSDRSIDGKGVYNMTLP